MMRAFGAREEENPQSAKSQIILSIVKRNFVLEGNYLLPEK